MNKAFLLIAAAAGAYALLRPKTNASVGQTAAQAPATGAASWAATASATTTPAASTVPSWLSTLASGVQTGAGIYTTIKDAVGHSAPVVAGTSAAGGAIWAGPAYQQS